MTHDVLSCSANGMEYEYFVRCRACSKTAVWEVAQIANQVTPAKQAESKEGVIDGRVAIVGLVRPRGTSLDAPEHTPPHLKLIFDEGAECMSIGTWNASSAMFRKIVDQISKERMNASPSGPPEDKRTRFNLKPRLEWLFANNLLPKEVERLADAIREDGNDGVHNAPLGEADALDIQDFTVDLDLVC
jgi:Domain of unknown function (DUF4145)